MLVKKVNPEWKPSEMPSLKVGEIIDITDPRALILSGDVKAVGKHGVELSSYELYGVITKDEREEFEAWKELRKQEAMKSKMEKEIAELKKEAAKIEGKKEIKQESEEELTPTNDALEALKKASKTKK